MHPLETHILSLLILNDTLRYSRLKPKDVESNLFVYHLKKLIDLNLVQKTQTSYSLTTLGRRYADRFSSVLQEARVQPKIVTMIVCQNAAGEWLLCERLKQPFLNQIGFPYGKLHLGESLAQAAERELLEKSGLTATLSRRGEAYLRVYEADLLISHMLCHVFMAKNPKGELLAPTATNRCFWGDPLKIDSRQLQPGFVAIWETVKARPAPIFLELEYRLV